MTRYELLDRIGVGGMAEIFRGKAVAAGGFEKPVAIKRILPHLSADRRFVELLIAEAKVLSLLKHRNIVQIFDVGLGDDGKYFLVMEYVDGRDLRSVQLALEARRRRMPFDLALHIGAEICEALEHAHTARAPDGKPMSLVHRDVSPSNVLLSRSGEVKLTDFGIAKRAEQETQHAAVRGKFAYISPEQARNEPLGARSDVFSVAILLWELVCGRRLFSGLGDLEALRGVREAAVPRPRDIDPRLSPELDSLLMAALSRDPTKRPTAGQLTTQLRSMRYALDTTVGDPAAELAKIIDDAVADQRHNAQRIDGLRPPPIEPVRPPAFDSGEPSEATVIRIRTADDFAARGGDAGMAHARQVIDRFDEEETRQAQLSKDQLALLRSNRDSVDLDTPDVPPSPSSRGAPIHLPGVRPIRATDEQTVARMPLDPDDVATLGGEDSGPRVGDVPPNQHFAADESTRLVARGDHRPPGPHRDPFDDSDSLAGTVHGRNAGAGAPMIPSIPNSIAPTMRIDAYREPASVSVSVSASEPSLATPAPLPPHPALPPPPRAEMIPGATRLPPPSRLGPTQPPPPVPQPAPSPAPLPAPPAAPLPAAPPMPQPWGPPPPAARAPRPPSTMRPTVKPWVLIVAAIGIAVVAFAITRILLS